MMRYLIFVSLSFILGCTGQYHVSKQQGAPCDVSFRPVSDTTMVFNTAIGIQGMSVSGIIILHRESDDKIRFVLIAEAGPTLIDLDLKRSGYSKNYVFKKLDRKVILDLFYQDMGIVTGIFADDKKGYFVSVDSGCCCPLKRNSLLCYLTNDSGFPEKAFMSSKKKKKTSVKYFYSDTGTLDSISVDHHRFDMHYTLYKGL
jgi:hypothetical protein